MRVSFESRHIRRVVSWVRAWRRRAFWATVSVVILGVLLCVIAGWRMPLDEGWLAPSQRGSRVMLDTHGVWVREVHDGHDRYHAWRELDDISEPMQWATLHAEDHRFYTHSGVDFIAIARSCWFNLRVFQVRTGASTITQQTIKLMRTRPASEHRIMSKFAESALAIKLEHRLDKPTILTHYLNRAPYGHQRFGVEAASMYYFGRSASELDWAHAAFLAGLPRAPSALDPRHAMGSAMRVQRQILANLRRHARISERTYRDALDTPIILTPPTSPHHSLIHPTTHALAAHPELDVIHTTLDVGLQQRTHEHLAHHVDGLSTRGISQAAAIIVDTQSGAVRASIGSRDVFARDTLGANDGVHMRRRPGSTLKPFVYGTYLARGGTLADPIADVATTLRTSRGTWSPQNFDYQFHGPVSVRDALGSSLNVPAVLVASAVGPDTVLSTLRALGMSLPDGEDHYGAGIALGNAELSLFELAQAYATLARGGRYRPLSYTRRELVATKALTRPAMSEQVAFLLLDVLADDAARRKGFGRGSALEVPFFMAAKTGTSTGFRDTWAVGVTPRYTIAVWAGNFDGSPTDHMSGATGAAPLMRTLMMMLHEDGMMAPMPPEQLWRRSVCVDSGQDTSKSCACTHTLTEWFRRPTRGALAHVDARGRHLYPQDPGTSCPMHRIAQGTHVMDVPGAWRKWANARGVHMTSADIARPDEVWMMHPIQGDRYMSHVDHERAYIKLRAAAPATTAMWWWVDGSPWRRAEPPFSTSWPAIPGTHVLGIGTASKVLHTITIEVIDP